MFIGFLPVTKKSAGGTGIEIVVVVVVKSPEREKQTDRKTHRKTHREGVGKGRSSREE